MYQRVTIGEGEHFREQDVSNLGTFPQVGDEMLTEDWLGTARYRGFATVKDGQNAAVVSTGAAYVNFRQYALEAAVTISLVAEKPLIAGQKRVVILAAQGVDDRPAPATSRDKTVEVPDGAGGTTTQDIVVTTSPYVRNVVEVAKLASGLSTQELDPVVPANVVPFCRIVLDVNGIVGDPEMLDDHRIKSVNDLDAIISQQGAVLDVVRGEVQALRNDLVGISGFLKSTVSYATLDQIIYDVATLKDVNDIGDTGAPYALDRLANDSEVNTAHPDFKGRVDEGLQAPYAAEDRVPLSLFNANDIRLMHQDKGVLFPAYDPEIGHIVHSTGQTAPLGGTVTQTMQLVRMHMTRVRIRYGGYYHYMNPLLWHPLRYQTDIVYRVWAQQAEAFAYPYGYYINRYPYWNRYWRYGVIVDRYVYSYDVWRKTNLTIQGVIKGQTWLQSQERYIPAIRLGLINWENGAEITVALCKLRADGSPDPEKVLQTVTLTSSSFVRYVRGKDATMTRFAFPVPAHVGREGVGYLTSVTGNVTVAMATGDQFLGGNYFESTDGNFFVGSITQDMAHAVEYCKFRATTLDVRLNNLSLSGGVQNVDINCPAIVPDNTGVAWQANSGGAWKTMANLPADETAPDPDPTEVFGVGTTATYDFRAFLTGNEWVMPVLELSGSERTAFRSDDDVHYISIPRSVPSGTTWAKVVVTATIPKYDAVRHTLSAKIHHGTALTTVVNPDGAPVIKPVPENNAVEVTWEFTVDPANDVYETHVLAATNNIAFPIAVSKVFSKVIE
ncbi:hypothetical protein [Shinella sp. DD12]|uniref:hypothetical protein n=1 Tax=Shinella sp. DD12 TaxID=1410620 RepID=UPI000437BDFD|nr:hypothetical protein [Shinella sp. DD12]EYR81879.1 hypothetical protein SHLA_4c001710 [Shinella sp. DD12]